MKSNWVTLTVSYLIYLPLNDTMTTKKYKLIFQKEAPILKYHKRIQRLNIQYDLSIFRFHVHLFDKIQPTKSCLLH